MFIDTRTKVAMENGLCDYLNIPNTELLGLFRRAGSAANKGSYFAEDIFSAFVNEFISANMPPIPIKQVLFFHLSRRLNSAKDCPFGNNLYDLLTQVNAMTDFWRKHEVQFFACENKIDILYQGKVISLEDKEKRHVSYLRWRLGYSKRNFDFCFNGFLLRDLLCKNDYAKNLSRLPEFVGSLTSYLKRQDIAEDYYKNSKYLCYEYCVPIEETTFDDAAGLQDGEKQVYLLSRIIHRLYDYTQYDERYISDGSNPIIRLTESATMPKEYYVSRVEITEEMLANRILRHK